MNTGEKEMLKEGNKSTWRFWKSILYTLGIIIFASSILSFLPITTEGFYFIMFCILLFVIFYCTFTILDEIRKR